MTGDEITLAIELVRATFLPGSFDKRFAHDMAAQAALDSELPLTHKQHLGLLQMAIRYRRQLKKEVVALANQMMLDEHAEEIAGGGPHGVMDAGGTCGNYIQPLPLPG